MPSSPSFRTPHLAQLRRMAFRPKAFSAASAILSAILTGCAGAPTELDLAASQASRRLNFAHSFNEQAMDLIYKRDWRALVELKILQANSNRSLGDPLMQAEALASASNYAKRQGDTAAAALYMKQALDVVIGMKPPGTFDRDRYEFMRVAYRLQLSKLALEDGNRVADARALMEEFRSECVRVGDYARRQVCDTENKGGYGPLYLEVQAKLGDPAALKRQQQDQDQIQAELATLSALSKQMSAAQRLADHAGVTRIGAELSDQLAKRERTGRFVAALVELDRAAAFRALGDAASKESSERMAQRRISEGNFGLQLLKEEAKLADEISLPRYAEQLRAEAVAFDSLKSQEGLLGGAGIWKWAEPQKVLNERAALLSSSDHLQSRGAYLSAEFARDRARAVSAAYQERVAEIATERAAAEKIRAEDARREREGRDQLLNAIAVTAQSLAAIERQKAAQDARIKADAERRAAEQNRMQRAASTNVGSMPNPGTTYSPPGQSASASSTAGQMHSGNARDMPTAASRGTQQAVAAPAGQPTGNGTKTPVSIEFSHRGENITGGRANKFRVYVENKTSIRGNCVVNGTYEYVSDSNGQPTSIREALPIILPANGQGYADFSRADRNVRMKEWEVSCSPL